MLLWQMSVAGNNTTYVGLHVRCPILHWNKRMFVCWWPSLGVQFCWTERHVFEQFLSCCKCRSKAFQLERWN